MINIMNIFYDEPNGHLPSVNFQPKREIIIKSYALDVEGYNKGSNATNPNSTSNPVGSKTSNYPLTYNTGLILGILLILIIIATDIYIHRKFP